MRNRFKGTSAESYLPAGHEMWYLEVQHLSSPSESSAPWKRLFAFTEHEFHPADCHAASYFVSTTMPLFTSSVLAIRYIPDEETQDVRHLYRVVLFGNEVRVHRTDGETRVLATLQTEADRVRALREIFGLEIKDEDIQFIVGTKAEMK